MLNLSSGAGYFFVNYMVDAVSKVFQYDYDGNLVREVKLPGIGSCGGFDGKQEDKELYSLLRIILIPVHHSNLIQKMETTTFIGNRKSILIPQTTLVNKCFITLRMAQKSQ